MRYYLSGKITGDAGYREKFAGYEARYARLGLRVANPARHEKKGRTWSWYMKCDIRMLTRCGGIIMLPDWKESEGARLEHHLAEKLGLTIIYAPAEDKDVRPAAV